MAKIKKVGCVFLILILGISGIVALYVASQIYILPSQDKVSTTLNALYAEDQDVRVAGLETPVDFIKIIVGDWIRVNKVRRIVSADLLTTPEDYANAARLLQHGSKASDYQMAQELSIQAYEMGEEDMLRHSGLAEDRYLTTIGEPQKYGTQFFCDPEQGWQLYPVDATVSDEARARFSIQPLAEMEMRVEQLNNATEGECSLSGETMRLVEEIMDE